MDIPKSSKILTTRPSEGYELVDSGEGEKLERFRPILMRRPDPQALWPKRLPETEWKKAQAYFTRESDQASWSFRGEVPASWAISFAGLKLQIKPTAFKHTGLFPEQAPNWEWMRALIERNNQAPNTNNQTEVLNLFGYTGGASLACAQAGAKVVHIDSSKAAVAWARENAELSGLADKPIRWIVEDARLFVEREIRRGRSYDAIIMDPPAFGHGANNELWKIEDDFLTLIDGCMKLLKPEPLFFLINGYSAGYSAIAYGNDLAPLVDAFGGSVEIGELALEESPTPGKAARLLPAGIFARWAR